MERSKELERMSSELQRLQSENEELEFQMQDMQNTLDAKKQVEYYSNIIGMALPGLAKFLTNSPMGAAMNFLAGTEQEDKNIEQGKGFRLMDKVGKGGSGTFEFASSNELWRAS
mgnify:CR=1 FL=1